jgi:uncharacterized protein
MMQVVGWCDGQTSPNDLGLILDMPLNDTDAFLRDILLTVETIAMVGASDKETRPSFGVFAFLLAQGYHVIGVNPGLAGRRVHGTTFFKSLADIPEPIDMVDIFRNSAAAGAVVDEALARGRKRSGSKLS